ncbi:MAG TPA: hypothetical protein V6D18_07585, partial [Thermosynechococcaceae cyanobacterium]
MSNDRDIGFFRNLSLVLNAFSGFPLGISDVQLWSRSVERLGKQISQHLAMPDLLDVFLISLA